MKESDLMKDYPVITATIGIKVEEEKQEEFLKWMIDDMKSRYAGKASFTFWNNAEMIA